MDQPRQVPLRVQVSMDVPNRRPSVILRLGDFKTELSVERAREFGQAVMSIATEAEIQGFLLDWMTQHFGQFTVEQATALAMQFRQYRSAGHRAIENCMRA